MTPLRAAIVDDEPLARRRLERMLGDLGGVEVVGSYPDGAAALSGLAQVRPDVVFLDVRMPGLDGFELLERMPAPARPRVVVVSAYGERALEAFAVDAVDYLVKPLSPVRLREAVERVRARMAPVPPPSAPLREPAPAAGGYLSRLAVPDGPRLRVVAVDEISMLVAQGNYVELVLPGRSLLLRQPLAALLDRLDPARFVRVHRSRAVRIDLVEQVEPLGAGQYRLRLRDGTRLASGRRYRQALRAALGLEG